MEAAWKREKVGNGINILLRIFDINKKDHEAII